MSNSSCSSAVGGRLGRLGSSRRLGKDCTLLFFVATVSCHEQDYFAMENYAQTYQLLASNAKLGRGHRHCSNGMREDECPFQSSKIDGIV